MHLAQASPRGTSWLGVSVVGSQHEDLSDFKQEAISVVQCSHHRTHAAFLHIESSFLPGDEWVAYLPS